MTVPERRLAWCVPAALAVAGLAVPMIGSGFVGWPFAAGWVVALVLVWWVRPLGGAERSTRLGAGALAMGTLVLLATVGGLYLAPALVAWLVLVAVERGAGAHEPGPPGDNVA
jgi:hypothetical protein